MQSGFVVDGDFFAGFNVAQRDKENVIVKDLHEGVWGTRMIYVMRAIAAATAIQTPAIIDFTNSQCLSMRTPLGFSVRNLFAGVFRDLMSPRKRCGGKTSFAVNIRRFDREPRG